MERLGLGVELIGDLAFQGVRRARFAPAEIEAQHRIASAPVPVVLQIQPREQLPAAGEGALVQ